MTARSLPPRPNLNQLKHQAKELLRRQPQLGRLRDAQRTIAEEYGFASWDALRKRVESLVGAVPSSMIKPPELDSEEGGAVWNALTASDDGDVDALRRLVERDPRLGRAEYWYTPAIHFAVREGHSEAVQLLLDAGADPEWNGLHDGSLIVMARERGHAEVARLLEEARDRRGHVLAGSDSHPIHAAISREDTKEVRRLLDVDPGLVDLGNEIGASPLHRAVGRGVHELAELLLDRGANVHAVLSSARGLRGGFWTDLQAIDLAIWDGRRPGDRGMIRSLLEHGATCDLTVAAALGDVERVRQILDAEPARIRETRPSGRRPLSAAIEAGHDAVARLLLDRGVDPNWGEPTAPKGRSLQVAAAAGKRELVELLLAYGADPNSNVDSSGNAVSAAATPEIRALLLARGGTPDPYDTSWIDDDEELRRVAGDPTEIVRISAAFAMVVGGGRRDRLERLLTAGLRVPSVLTGCQSYLLTHTDMLRALLAHGMSPDLMNWQRQTLLHHICRHPAMKRWISSGAADAVQKAAILLDAGADISARDEEYRSTPLAWAARTGASEMVAFLLSRGAPTNLPDDEPWATPLAWAERRHHAEIVSVLRQNGADR
ncbi:MAG: ankyrin repeat domain-containing protein [Vicinamibacterales bacterium]